MPARVPRTEYSAEMHWELIFSVTGLSVSQGSSEIEKRQAQKAFYKAWNYDFGWNTLIHNQELGEIRTSMGHAEYASEGADYNVNVSCPFKTPEQVLDFDPMATYGPPDQKILIDRFNQNYRERCELIPDAVNTTGIYITCISGLIEIFGWDMMLMAMGTDPEKFGKLTNRYAQWMQHYYDALAKSDCPVVMVHDDIVWTSGPFTRPDWYREYVFPNFVRYFAPLIEAGKKIIFTSDGDYTAFVDDIAKTGVHGFVMEPVTDMRYIAQRYGKTHVFIGNADTMILLYGTKEQIYAEVQRCMDIGKKCPGFIMAVGNHIPPNTPVENAIYYNQVYQKLGCR